MVRRDQDGETIAAIATPPGRGGVGIVRVSGAKLACFVRSITGRDPVPRKAVLSPFLDEFGESIDEGIILFFPAPASYTGEDVLELQGHGGPVVMQMLLKRCLQLGARLAEPGEFTKRAFLNDKLDLARAESVADLIEASTEAAARCAMRSFRGEFSGLIETLVAQLVELRMLVEAMLDFPEEETDPLDSSAVPVRLLKLRNAVAQAIQGGMQGSLLRSGLQVVLAGRPNVGKSSLMNRLARDEVAIVTTIPGTTRDSLRHTIEIQGIPVTIVDTAGLRESSDEVERLGIVRTWENARNADLVLVVLEADKGVTPEDMVILDRFPPGARRLLVFNKADLLSGTPSGNAIAGVDGVYVSARTGRGIHELETAVLSAAGWSPVENIIMARERHIEALKQAERCLVKAEASIDQSELLAEELRLAQSQLGTITGEFSADDLLGEIFSRFCIGK